MNIFFILLKLYYFILILSKANLKEIEKEEEEREDFISEEYESLLNWAKKNLLNMTDKIKLTEYNEEKQYIATKSISKGEIIFDIPQNITLNIKTFYSYFPSKKLEKKYDKYLKLGKKSNKMLNDISYIDQSFMAFLLYKINKLKEIEEKNYEINNFFEEYYKYISFIFEDDLSHLPSSFTNEQTKKFMNTSFSSFYNLMNGYLVGETEILKQEIFKDDINLDEYFKYRFLLLQKTFNISNTTSLVPFVDLIKHDFNNKNINCKIVVNKDRIRIKAIKEIKGGELLIIKQKKITNQYSFFFYGKTYDELIDYMPSFIIPIIIPDILIDEGIELNIQESGEENQIDLVWDKYYEIIIPTYKEVLKLTGKDDSIINCYNLFLKYITLIRDTIRMNKVDELKRFFSEKRDIDNIKRIIKGEIVFLDKKIKELENVIEKNKNENKRIKSDKNIRNNKTEQYEDL